MSQIQPATHEVEADFTFAQNGLSPYWALTSLLTTYDGHAEDVSFQVDGEPWSIEFYYQSGGIAPRPTDSVGGDTLYEPRLALEGPERRSINFHVRPRYEGMETPDGDEISTPFDHIDAGEGISVRAAGSNVMIHRYPDLLRRAVHTLAENVGESISWSYFRDPHPMSNVQSFELYVRIRREVAESLIAADGPMNRAATLLSTKRGAEGAYFFNNAGPSGDTLGYRHRFLLHSDQAHELVTGHRFGKQIKSYHPEKPRDDPEDPLYHPKLGVLFSSTKDHLGNPTAYWADVDELERELQETLVNLLSWSGIETRPDPTTFISDDAFSPVPAEEPVRLMDDPLPEIEAEQESLVVRTLNELTDSDEELLRVMADGGEMHVSEAAEETDRSLSTIYRALDRLEGVIQNENGALSWISEKFRQDLQAVIDTTEQAIESGVRRLCQLLDMDPRQLKQQGSAWQKWLNKWGGELLEKGDERLWLKISTITDRLRGSDCPIVDELVADALSAWLDSGGDIGHFMDGMISWTDRTGQQHEKPVTRVLNLDGTPKRSTPGPTR